MNKLWKCQKNRIAVPLLRGGYFVIYGKTDSEKLLFVRHLENGNKDFPMISMDRKYPVCYNERKWICRGMLTYNGRQKCLHACRDAGKERERKGRLLYSGS